jgi:hypothetical protein
MRKKITSSVHFGVIIIPDRKNKVHLMKVQQISLICAAFIDRRF